MLSAMVLRHARTFTLPIHQHYLENNYISVIILYVKKIRIPNDFNQKFINTMDETNINNSPNSINITVYKIYMLKGILL